MNLLVARVYGREGHRQKESFNDSKFFNFSNGNNARIIVVLNSDVTGTNKYSEIFIIGNSEKECYSEFYNQLSDGIFENYCLGDFEFIKCIEV